jgi:dihydroorotate dehydrogenase
LVASGRSGPVSVDPDESKQGQWELDISVQQTNVRSAIPGKQKVFQISDYLRRNHDNTNWYFSGKGEIPGHPAGRPIFSQVDENSLEVGEASFSFHKCGELADCLTVNISATAHYDHLETGDPEVEHPILVFDDICQKIKDLEKIPVSY